MTQEQAAAACGLNRATWRLWEAGGSPRNMADVVAKITRGLGVDRDWLLWGGPLASEDTDPGTSRPASVAFRAPAARPTDWYGVAPAHRPGRVLTAA
jgi:transcriptional regulator with XRE-family HTH domain